jgi:hypothetical protein
MKKKVGLTSFPSTKEKMHTNYETANLAGNNQIPPRSRARCGATVRRTVTSIRPMEIQQRMKIYP